MTVARVKACIANMVPEKREAFIKHSFGLTLVRWEENLDHVFFHAFHANANINVSYIVKETQKKWQAQEIVIKDAYIVGNELASFLPEDAVIAAQNILCPQRETL